MDEVTIRDLRNKGGDVLDRVMRGESLTVTRDGRPVAELRPLAARSPSAASLLRTWRKLPPVDPWQLRADIDRLIDAGI